MNLVYALHSSSVIGSSQGRPTTHGLTASLCCLLGSVPTAPHLHVRVALRYALTQGYLPTYATETRLEHSQPGAVLAEKVSTSRVSQSSTA